MSTDIETTATEVAEEQATAAAPLATLPTQQLPVGAGQQQVPGWGAAAHLSPVAAFQPDRVDICTEYQMAAVVDATATASHLTAALRHVCAAADRVGGEEQDRVRVSAGLRLVRAELDRTARRLHISY